MRGGDRSHRRKRRSSGRHLRKRHRRGNRTKSGEEDRRARGEITRGIRGKVRIEGRKIRTEIRTPRQKIPTCQRLIILRQTQHRSLIRSEIQRLRGERGKGRRGENRSSLACRKGDTNRRKRTKEWQKPRERRKREE